MLDFIYDNRGSAVVEYGLVLALIGLAAVGILKGLGIDMQDTFLLLAGKIQPSSGFGEV